MDLDPDVVASLVVPYQPTAYLRVTPIAHRTTPLGMGFGKTRFASPTDAFKLLYIAEDLATGLAEAVIRDRFEGATARELTAGELADSGVTEVSARAAPSIGHADRGLFSSRRIHRRSGGESPG
jgi:hypothetical protein